MMDSAKQPPENRLLKEVRRRIAKLSKWGKDKPAQLREDIRPKGFCKTGCRKRYRKKMP